MSFRSLEVRCTTATHPLAPHRFCESLEAAVVRELREETGLAVRPVAVVLELTLEREGFAYRITDFLCELDGGDENVRAGDDVDDARWVAEADLAALGLTPEVLRVVARARAMGS